MAFYSKSQINHILFVKNDNLLILWHALRSTSYGFSVILLFFIVIFISVEQTFSACLNVGA